MNTLSVLLLLLAAASAHATWATRHLAQASANQTADFATTHSASGTAVGNVAWTGKGTGQDTQIGGCCSSGSTSSSSAADCHRFCDRQGCTVPGAPGITF